MEKTKDIALCDRHIAELERRIEDLRADPAFGSGFSPVDEMLGMLQSTGNEWVRFRKQLERLS